MKKDHLKKIAASARMPRARLTPLFAVLAGTLTAVQAQLPDPGRFESLEKQPSTRTTGTPLPADRPEVFRGKGEVDYSANERVGGIVVEVEQDGLPADGQAANRVTVKLFDKAGKPLSGAAIVTIEHSGGRLLFPGASTDEQGPGRKDIDALVPGFQLEVRDGVGHVTLLAPFEPQDVRLRVTAGGQEASGVVSYLPDLREWLAAGVVDGVINLRHLGASALQQARPEDGFEREMRHWQRQFSGDKGSASLHTSFFLKGRIKGEYLLTAAYDSDKETRQRLSETVNPEEFYPVYGDSALRGTDVRSDSKLFVRIDNGKSYGLWGNFGTASDYSPIMAGTPSGLKIRDLGVYSRNVTGFKWHHESPGHAVNVFAARDNLKQIIDEFPGLGVSGPYALSNTGALLGTERVEIIVRDRNQRSLILSTTVLAPLVDYTYEPFSGRLLMKQPVPSVDSNLNPVSIRVTYELEQGGPDFWLAGADGQLKLSDSIEVGGSLVKDNNPLAPYRLGSANVGFKLGPRTMIVAEVAQTQSDVNSTASNIYTTPGLAGRTGEVEGRAARVEMRHEEERWLARAYAGRSDPEFNNAAASLNGGRGEAGARAEYKLTDSTKVYGQVLRSEDRVSGGERKAADVAVVHKLSETLEIEAGLRSVREDGTSSSVDPALSSQIGASSAATGNGFYGIGNSSLASPNGTGIINNGSYSTTGSTATPVDADTARLGLKWKATDRWTLGGEAETSFGGEKKRRIAVGADYQLTERSKVYGRFENQNALASVLSANPADKSRALVFGVSSSFLTNSEVYSEYRLRDAIDADTASARDLQLATGVQNVINVRPGLRYTAGAEHLKVMSGGGREGYALTGAVEWTQSEIWKASTRLEYRRISDDPATAANDRQDSWLSTASVARKLDRDWTALARNYLLASDDLSLPGRRLQDRFQLGAAYRPVDHNRFDALMKLEYKVDRNEELATGAETTRTTIASAHANYHPVRPLWLAGRLAAKWTRDPYGSYNAYLASGRVTWDFAEKWDASLLTSVKWSPTGSARQWAQGVELGYALQQNLWLSVGANWAGFSDRELAGSDYTNRGVFIRLRFKFDEDLFRRGEPRTNKALTPQ